MSTEAVPYGRKTQRPSPVSDVHILWMTAGLGCDGDSVSITAATQPSIEDVLLGAIPGFPKVHLHNPVLAYEDGRRFSEILVSGRKGQARSICVGGGRLDPERKDKEGRILGALGTDPDTGQPITTNEWIDRLAPKALAIVGCGHLRDLWRNSRHGREIRPDAMGLEDYLGRDWQSKAGLPDRECSGMPGAARQLHGDAAVPLVPGSGIGSDDPAG